MTGNRHFETVRSWKAARTMLAFQSPEPKNTAGHRLQSIIIHVRDYKLRELSVAERTLEARYGCFVISQAQKGVEQARTWRSSCPTGMQGAMCRLPDAQHACTDSDRNRQPTISTGARPAW
jgi:hypothetical protein